MIETLLMIFFIVFGIILYSIDIYVYSNYKDTQEDYDRPRGFYTLIVIGNGFGKSIPKKIKIAYCTTLFFVFFVFILLFLIW